MKGRVQQKAPLPGSEPRAAADAPVPDVPANETEPEAPAAAPVVATAPNTTDPPVVEEPEAPAPPEDPRLAIGKRAREIRDAAIAEAAKDPQVQVLDTYAGAQSAEVTEPAATAQPITPPTDSAPPKAPAAVVAGPEAVDGIKINVYGEEVVVTEDEVRTAGIATLQKERAAEYRLQEASKAEAGVRKYHKELDDYRAQLKQMEQDLRAGKLPGAKGAATVVAPPTTGATTTVDDTKLAESARKAAEAIYRGDPAETAKALKALLADVAQGRTATPPPVDEKAVAEAAADIVDQRTETRTTEQKRKAVNETFSTEFPTVLAHPEAFAVAQTKFGALLADPANAGKPWEDIAREAGKAALHRYPELRAPAGEPSNVPGGQPPPAQTVDQTLQARRTLKSKTVVRQPTTGVRAPAPQPQPVRSNKQFIADLRASRGLPPTG